MVKVKTFTIGTNEGVFKHEILDNQINEFLAENDVELIDIKYSTCSNPVNLGGVGRWTVFAMLIYKEK